MQGNYLDENLLPTTKVMAARSGRREYQIVEEALRFYLGLERVKAEKAASVRAHARTDRFQPVRWNRTRAIARFGSLLRRISPRQTPVQRLEAVLRGVDDPSCGPFWTNPVTPTEERSALLQRSLAVFGTSSIRALLADREFVGEDWVQWLQSERIPVYLRLKRNTLIPNAWNVPMRAASCSNP